MATRFEFNLRRRLFTWLSIVRSRTKSPLEIPRPTSCERVNCAPGAAQKALQQPELRRRQVELGPVREGPVLKKVNAHTADLQHLGLVGGGTASIAQRNERRREPR